jgi:hypothetical protein
LFQGIHALGQTVKYGYAAGIAASGGHCAAAVCQLIAGTAHHGAAVVVYREKVCKGPAAAVVAIKLIIHFVYRLSVACMHRISRAYKLMIIRTCIHSLIACLFAV